MPTSVFCCRRSPRRPLSLFVVALSLAGTASLSGNAALAAEVPAAQAAAPQPPAAPQPTANQLLSAQGTVRDPDGKPVKGATVIVLRIRRGGRGDTDTLVTHTDEAGHFTVQMELSPEDIKVMARRVGQAPADAPHLTALIHAAGFAVSQQSLVAVQSAATPAAQTAATPQPALPANDIALARGFSARGQVTDEDGKPVVGAIVHPSWVNITNSDPSLDSTFISFYSLPEASPVWAEFQATSDAEGHFILHDLPQGTASVALEDPRFVRQGIQLRVSENSATAPLDKASTLVARSGGVIRGRVLYPDGKPASKVFVIASTSTGRDSVTANTGDDGTYTLTKIGAGKVTVAASPPSPEWAATRGPNVTVVAGQTAKAADLTLSHGVLLEGYVRDADTRAPLAGVGVGSYSAPVSGTNVTTDAGGRYQMRVPTGDVQINVNEVPTDYIQSYDANGQVTVSEQSHKAPDFLLSKGVTLSGTAKDGAGKPAVGAIISVSSDRGMDSTATVDAQGNWTLRGVNDKDWQNNRVTSLKLKASGPWEVQGNATVNLPAQPLNLVLNHITLQDTTVRVVTTDGQPVADATVTYKLFLNPERNSYSTLNATSNAKGEIVVPRMRPEQAAELTANKAGYVVAQKGSVGSAKTGNGNEVRAHTSKDIVMTRLDAQISGRVVDAGGQPAAGVTVVALFPKDLRDLPDDSVQTDAQGRFTLKGLAQGEVTIGAARGRAFGQVTLKTGETAELKLGAEEPPTPPQAVDLAFQQLEHWVKEKGPAAGNNDQRAYQIGNLATKLARYDPERAQRAVTDDAGTVSLSFLYSASLSVARTDPKKALALSKTLFPLIKQPELAVDLKLRLAVLTAAVEPEAAQQTYDAIAPDTAPTTFNAQAATRYAELAALAGALHSPDAEGWLQALTLSTGAFNKDEQRYYFDEIAKLLAGGDLPTARRWAAQLQPTLQLQTLGSLVAWAAKRDPKSARAILSDMETLAARPDFPVEAARTNGNYQPSASDILNSARLAVVRVLMSTDLKAAGAMAQQLATNNMDNINLRNEIEARLAGANDADAARTLLASAGQNWEDSAGAMARIAALLAPTLPQVSAQGFRDAREKLSAHTADNGNDESAAGYAYAVSALHPAEARLLLENEWLRARQTQKAGGGEMESWEAVSRQIGVIRAMLPLSVARATEMLQLGQADNKRFLDNGDVLTQVIQWLISDEATRRALSIQRYGRVQDDD